MCDTDFSFGGEQEIPLTIEITPSANINFRREIFESESVLGKAEKIVKDIVEDVIESELRAPLHQRCETGVTSKNQSVSKKKMTARLRTTPPRTAALSLSHCRLS